MVSCFVISLENCYLFRIINLNYLKLITKSFIHIVSSLSKIELCESIKNIRPQKVHLEMIDFIQITFKQ